MDRLYISLLIFSVILSKSKTIGNITDSTDLTDIGDIWASLIIPPVSVIFGYTEIAPK